ncbi:MAG: DUF11 domain-containing protein [Lysobacterales bacterium]
MNSKELGCLLFLAWAATASFGVAAEATATSGSASAYGVSADLVLDVPGVVDVTAVLSPLPSVAGTAPPDFNQVATVATASLALGSLGNVLATGVLDVSASSTLSTNQTDAVATTNQLAVQVDPAGAPPPIVVLNSTLVRATAAARCVAGNVNLTGTTNLVGAQLALQGGAFVSLASNPAPNTNVPIVGIAGLSIILNEQIVAGNQITVNGIHIRYLNLSVVPDFLTGDIIVSQAVASLADCAPQGSNADVSIVKTALGPAIAGGQMTYEIRVTNSGPDAANGTILRDPAVANFTATGLTCGSATGGAVCPAGMTIAQLQGTGITIGTLPSGGSLVFMLTGTVGQSGQIVNVATVTVPPGTIDPNPGNNTDPETTPIVPAGGGADVGIVKTALGPAIAGGQMTYEIRVTNSGPAAANGTILRDPAVANFTATGVTCGSATGGAVCPAGMTIAQLQGTGITIGSLPSGGSLVFLLTGTVGQSGQIVNVATVTVPPGTIDPNPGNNTDPETTPIVPAGGSMAVPVPALDRSGLALLVLLFAGIGWFVMQRQSR